MNELKPCPFCGSECRVDDYPFGGTDLYKYYVICPNCGATDGTTDHFSEEDVVKSWNTRSERTCEIYWDDFYESYICSSCDRELPYWACIAWDDYQADKERNKDMCFFHCPCCGARIE